MTGHVAFLTLAAHATTTTVRAVPAAAPAPLVPGLTGTTFLLALVAFVAVMVLIGRVDALARLPLVLVGTVASVAVGLGLRFGRGLVRTAARRLDFRWPQWCWLAVTVLFVGDAQRHGVALRHAWAAVAFVWAVWFVLRLYRAWWQRKAPKRFAKAMRKTADAMQANARTSSGRAAARQANSAARKATKAAQPVATVADVPAPAARQAAPTRLPVGIPGLRSLAKAHQQRTSAPAAPKRPPLPPLPPVPTVLPRLVHDARRVASRWSARLPRWRRGR